MYVGLTYRQYFFLEIEDDKSNELDIFMCKFLGTKKVKSMICNVFSPFKKKEENFYPILSSIT